MTTSFLSSTVRVWSLRSRNLLLFFHRFVLFLTTIIKEIVLRLYLLLLLLLVLLLTAVQILSVSVLVLFLLLLIRLVLSLWHV